jgi:hypothetical protein
MAQWNQHVCEHEQGWKMIEKTIKNYNVHMFWPKMI